MTPSLCSTCGTCGSPIPEGQGRYITPDGIFCQACGLPFPLGPGVRVQIIITGLEDRHQDNKEATTHGKYEG
ncbi:MAG: hypothetical protein GXX82_08545 [Syntrophorhabdus sp.]|nr:hypothetical protein [Syntrophorhabdus sp.]